MTEERIAALEAMCQEAEKEPWHTDSSPYNESAPFMVRTPNGWVVAEGITHVMDAEFIAYARTALPELLAEVRRLRTALADISDGHCSEGYCDCKVRAFHAVYGEALS